MNLISQLLHSLSRWITDHKALTILSAINVFVFFAIWLLELNFGFRPTERVGWFFYGNDAHSYLDPIENLISNGTYAMRKGPTAFRMPGLLPFYGPLYLVFGKSIALHLLALVNLCFCVISSFLVYKLSNRFVQSSLALLIAICFAFYPRLSSYGYLGMTETIAASCIIICLYLFILWIKDPKRKYALVISFFLTVLIMLKPIAIVFLAILGIWIIVNAYRTEQKLNQLFVVLFIFFAIPTASLATWTIRNYLAFESFIPLTPTLSSKGADQAFRSFCRRTGLQFQSWQGKDARVWFVHPTNYMYDEDHANSDPFPDYLYTSKFNIDSLRNLRSDWHLMSGGGLSIEDSIKMDKDIESRFWLYAQSFIDEHPFHFFVTIRFTFLKDFLFIKDSFSPFKQNTLLFKALRAHYFLSYYLLVSGLVLGAISLFLIKRWDATLILGIAILYILFHIAMGRIENRYLLPVVPLFAVGIAIFMGVIQRFIQTNKTS